MFRRTDKAERRRAPGAASSLGQKTILKQRCFALESGHGNGHAEEAGAARASLVPQRPAGAAGPATSIDVAGTIIPNCTPIEATDQSRIFEIVWRYYVGYSVLNESYAAVYDAEQYEGTRFRIY